jgi:Na+/alanine symporter
VVSRQLFGEETRYFVAILLLFLAFSSLSTTFLTIENFNSIISGKKKMLPILRTSEVLTQGASYFAVED